MVATVSVHRRPFPADGPVDDRSSMLSRCFYPLICLCIAVTWMIAHPRLAHAQWRNVAPNVLPAGDYFAISHQGDIIWAGGDALVKSTDVGVNWMPVPSFPGHSIQDISFCDPLHGVIGTDGALFVTSDGGATWTSPFVGAAYNFSQVYCAAAGRVVHALNFSNSFLISTKDAGVTWQSVSAGRILGQTAHCFAIARDGTIYVFSANGTGVSQHGWITSSSDFGTTWSGTSTLVDGDSWSLAADSCDAHSLLLMNEDCATTNDGLSQIFRTTNAGGSWVSLPAAEQKQPYYAGGMTTTARTLFVSTVESGV
jgi:photosystem II stability/assembly factor-like uncharacterized protein